MALSLLLRRSVSRAPASGQRGFTLIELLVTLVVLAVVLGIAIPNMNTLLRNNRSLAFGDEFIGALNFTRSEAAKRGALVSLCAANDTQTACGNDWSNGWLAVVDSADETSGSVTIADADTDVLRVWEPAGEGLELNVSRGSGVDFVRFTGGGGLSRDSDQPIQVTAQHSDCSGDSVRSIRVSPAGSVRAIKTSC
ncbi:GspH/FimT family pseudopilin [Marinimicrobium sp. ARAG 43.8]|uniref:GspH/FimT family pseudopilin n=1 Tax=Marinimicrobium sp. ARAG 43.8 TaxID=3418719 RepID=UPI003CF31812